MSYARSISGESDVYVYECVTRDDPPFCPDARHWHCSEATHLTLHDLYLDLLDRRIAGRLVPERCMDRVRRELDEEERK